MGYDLRLRRSLRGKARPFRTRPFLYNLFSAAGRLSLPAAEKEKEIPPGKAEPFRKARGEAPRGLGPLTLGTRRGPRSRLRTRAINVPQPQGRSLC